MAEVRPGRPGRVFLSYRRQDTEFPAAWLYERLVGRLGHEAVFKDVDSIDLGDDFAEAIRAAVGSCDVLLAMIGPDWATITDEAGRRRLDDPIDFVRLEIETALQRDVRVIPILVQGATLPRAEQLPVSLAKLVGRQALELSPSRFEYDTTRLLRVLDKTITQQQARRSEAEDQAATQAREQLARQREAERAEAERRQQARLRHDYADLEIELQWDRHQDKFYVSCYFTVIDQNVDDWQSAEEPLSIDVQELRGLIADEQTYGAALTRMVLRPKDVEPFYLRARTRAEDSGRMLHMRLHLGASAPARYHALRWELLCDPDTGTPIATGSNVLLSRYLSNPDWRPIPAPDKHDLCALIVVAGPSDLQDYRPNGRKLGEVKVDEELARVQTALSGIPGIRSVHTLPGAATLTNIIGTLDQGVDDRTVDILYLVCHGALIEDAPWLYLENLDRTVDVVEGRRLVESLSALERRPMLIMLCSPQSASAGTEMWSGADDGGLSALGPRLASAGVGAVIAMQGNISMTTVDTFAPTFFKEVAQHGVVDEAMAAARRVIRERPDWWVPVLFSRLRSGRTYYTSGFAKREEQTWESLILQVRSRHFTPVVGPLLASRILGRREDIARAWARRWRMPIASHNQGDLAQVAEYLRVRTTPGFVRARLQEHLMKEIRERQRGSPQDPIWSGLPSALVKGGSPRPAIHAVGQRLRFSDRGDPHRILADLDTSLYVTTDWTDLLQDALKENGREPITMMFPWNDQIVMEDATTRYDGMVPTVERPVVYHLYGRLDMLSSLVLSEDDYFAWLNTWATHRESVPSFVRKALVTSSLLFLGYRLDDWDFRVLFQGIKRIAGSGLLRENQHVAVQLSRESSLIEPEAVQQYLEWSLGEAKVSIYWGDTRRFLDDMYERIVRSG